VVVAAEVVSSPFSFPPFFFDRHHFQTIDDVRYLFSPLSLAPHMPSLFCGKLLDDPSVAALFSSFSLQSCPIVGYICCLLAPAACGNAIRSFDSLGSVLVTNHARAKVLFKQGCYFDPVRRIFFPTKQGRIT
jgi:hypothetical protein